MRTADCQCLEFTCSIGTEGRKEWLLGRSRKQGGSSKPGLGNYVLLGKGLRGEGTWVPPAAQPS
jgi:hypothetical protein